jgi:hypothetical protein
MGTAVLESALILRADYLRIKSVGFGPTLRYADRISYGASRTAAQETEAACLWDFTRIQL